MPRHWYVGIVTPAKQDRVERTIRVQGHRVFNPRVRRKFPNKHTGGHFYRIGSYFPGYLFVQFDLVRDDWYSVLDIQGMWGFIKNETALPGEPSRGREMVRVRRGVVPAMMAELGDHFAVDERKLDEAMIRSGDRIRVLDGAYQGFETTAVGIRHSRIAFVLELFGRPHRVELPREALQLIGGER